MTYRTPFLQVLGPNGGDLVKLAGSSLIGVRLVDRSDFEADEAVLMFTRQPPYITPPAVGTPYNVRLGWSPANVAIVGHYTFQRVRFTGRAEGGEQMHLICRAGDFVEQLKGVDSEHFDERTGHKTLGDIFRSLFKATGKAVEIAPEIDKLPIPGGYALRHKQSAADFASELAQDVGAYFKPSGDKMVVLKRGAGVSVSGETLPNLQIRRLDGYDFDAELEPRWSFQSVGADWFDAGKGTPEQEKGGAGGGAAGSGSGQGALPHPSNSQAAAKAAAAAVSQEYGQFTGSGMFVQPGMPEAVAEAPATCSGFGAGIDDAKWKATTVTHDVQPRGGWITTIETEVN